MNSGDGGMSADRDRDATGRARNDRQRDGLGRPLPRGATGVPRQPEGIVRTPDETLREAQRLLDHGKPFHAHEVLEDAWKSAPEEARALWKGLAQLAVGATHAARGNIAGAVALLTRGAEHIAPYRDEQPYGIDVAGMTRWALGHAAALSRRAPTTRRDDAGPDSGPRDALPPPRLRPNVTDLDERRHATHEPQRGGAEPDR